MTNSPFMHVELRLTLWVETGLIGLYQGPWRVLHLFFPAGDCRPTRLSTPGLFGDHLLLGV